MTPIVAIFAAALSGVSAPDRMAMADRLFNRGDYATARTEYLALKGAPEVSAADVAYRLVSSANALNDRKATRDEAAAFLAAFPRDGRADRVRYLKALAGSDAERQAELKVLDRDDVPAAFRAEILYRLAEATGDDALYERCFKTDPEGRYAGYAKFAYATSMIRSDDPARRRQGDGVLMEIVYGKDAELARQAHYAVALHDFHEKRYGECSSLLKRYLKKYPEDPTAKEAARMLAESELLNGQYAAAVAACPDELDERFLYVKASAQFQLKNYEEAVSAARRYLDAFPAGKFRQALELIIARRDLEAAIAADDAKKILPAAKRCAALAETGAERLRLGWAYEKAGEAESAENEYAALARVFPGSELSADAQYRRGMSLLRREQYAAAEVAFAEALASGKLPSDRTATAFYWRGFAASRLGHDAEAVGFLKTALEGTLTLDERREARMIIADADFNAGRREAAATAYAGLVREGAVERMSAAKTRAVGRFLLGDEASRNAWTAAACACVWPDEVRVCAQALERSDAAEWRQAGFALHGDVERLSGDEAIARYCYQKCLEEPCETEVAAVVALNYGFLLVKCGDAATADTVLARAVKLNSQDAEARAWAYYGLARSARLQQDEEKALGYAKVVTALFERTKAAERVREEFLK